MDCTVAAIISPDLGSNAAGRAEILWRIARYSGVSVVVVGPANRGIWSPLAATEFSDNCIVVPWSRWSASEVADLTANCDLIIASKPLRSSYGVARDIRERTGQPLLLDVDDPDIEGRLGGRMMGQRIRRLMGHPEGYLSRDLLRIGAFARSEVTTVSNPWIQDVYGGHLVPHVRPINDMDLPAPKSAPTVGFIGTPHPHKGIDVLRKAVASLDSAGYQLLVTDVEPRDARPWEKWEPSDTQARSEALLGKVDIVAIPSLLGPFSVGQLPLKLIDAMHAGRAIVASDLPPIRWALGDAGVLVPPGDSRALEAALADLVDPLLRSDLGWRARDRARQRFTLEAVSQPFARAIKKAMTHQTRG